MVSLIKANIPFFSAFLAFLLIGGGLLVVQDPGDSILFWSDRRSMVGDLLFKYGTRLGEEYAFLLAIVLALFVRYRYALLIFLTGLAVMLTSFFSKMLFAHHRPLVFFRENDLVDHLNFVEGVQVHVGASSFPSGHTMAAFALFGMLAFLVPWKRWTGPFFFGLALLVGISRIYLIQHFLKDVYLGAILGVALAMILYGLQERLPGDTRSLLGASNRFSQRKRAW